MPVLLPACVGRTLAKTDGGATTTHDAGVSDAHRHDASATADRDATDVLYWQWWDPHCGVPGSPCTNRKCMTVVFTASPVGGCNVGSQFNAGCMPADLTTTGWSAYVSSDRQIINAVYYPYTLSGLSSCGALGYGEVFNPVPIACCPWLDGGGIVGDGGDGKVDARGSVDASASGSVDASAGQ